MVARLAIVGTGLIGASVGLAATRARRARRRLGPGRRRARGGRGARRGRAGGLARRGARRRRARASSRRRSRRCRRRSPRCSTPRARRRPSPTSARRRRASSPPPAARRGSSAATRSAGSEARGAEHASGAIFEGATWFLTPTAETDPERHRLVHGFVAELGAVPVAIDPSAHDRLVALTSHVPHVLANVVVNQAGAARIEGHEPLASAGGSLRDMTRIAGANPRIWVDIFLDNADAVRDALAEHRRRIEQVEAALDARRRRLPRRAGSARRPTTAGGCSSARTPTSASCTALRVHIPDRPGVFAEVTQALGAERINIEDFEMQHVSPERGGTLTLLVAGRGRGAARRRRCSRARATASSSRRSSMRIEPAARVDGHIGVPGDKSISHRALLIGALTEGETRVSHWGRERRHRVDARRRARARRRGGRGGRRHARRPRRRPPRARARRTGRSTAATPARSRGSSPACSRSSRAASSSSATSRSRAGRWAAWSSRSAGWARRSRPTDGRLPLVDRRRASCTGSSTSCRSRARR